MAPISNEDVVRRYLDAHMRHDLDELGRLRSPGWFEEWPQSRERVRGHANDAAIMTNWPGGQPMGETGSVVGSEDRWVMTPSFTYQRVVGEGDHWWADGVGRYPDGSTWYTVALAEVHDGQVHRETWFFGPQMEAPAWRTQWVERMDDPEPSDGR